MDGIFGKLVCVFVCGSIWLCISSVVVPYCRSMLCCCFSNYLSHSSPLSLFSLSLALAPALLSLSFSPSLSVIMRGRSAVNTRFLASRRKTTASSSSATSESDDNFFCVFFVFVFFFLHFLTDFQQVFNIYCLTGF